MDEQKKPVEPQYPEGGPDPDYKPGWIAKTLDTVTLGIVDKNSVRPAVGYGKINTADVRLSTVKVWSDIQRKMVPAYEYLRETSPVEEDIARQIGSEAVGMEQKVLRKQMARKGLPGIADPQSTARDYVINATIGKVPVAGKILGRAASKLAGLDVTEMGDATVDGAKRRANDAARAGYDQLAVHFKRNEVLAAVRGENYQPNFLMGIEHVRKVTDGFQDFTLKSDMPGENLLDRRSMDMSEAGDAYRGALWMGESSPEKAYKSAKSASLGKAAMNYDKKNAIPVA